jgi:hypothetical protein
MSSFLEKLYASGETELWAYGNGDKIVSRTINLSMNARNMRILKKIPLHVITNRIPPGYTKAEGYKNLTTVRTNKDLDAVSVYIIFGKKWVGIQIAKYHRTIYDLYNKGSRKVV